jgi:hypothetical protein
VSAAPKIDTGGIADVRIARLAQQTRAAVEAIERREVVTFTSVYTEPMSFALDHEPSGLQLIRLREDATPEAIVPAQSLVSFVYLNGKVTISELQGPTIGTRYRFAFEAIG